MERGARQGAPGRWEHFLPGTEDLRPVLAHPWPGCPVCCAAAAALVKAKECPSGEGLNWRRRRVGYAVTVRVRIDAKGTPTLRRSRIQRTTSSAKARKTAKAATANPIAA